MQARLNQTGAEQSGTLEKLVQNEGPGGTSKRPATEGLMWLLRALEFTALAMRNSITNKDEELVTSFTNAYGATLRPHHSMFVRPVFTLAMKACPYRKDFYSKLGAPQDRVDEQMQSWLAALEKIVTHMKSFYTYVLLGLLQIRTQCIGGRKLTFLPILLRFYCRSPLCFGMLPSSWCDPVRLLTCLACCVQLGQVRQGILDICSGVAIHGHDQQSYTLTFALASMA